LVPSEKVRSQHHLPECVLPEFLLDLFPVAESLRFVYLQLLVAINMEEKKDRPASSTVRRPIDPVCPGFGGDRLL
jgi:hypothetical protein